MPAKNKKIKPDFDEADIATWLQATPDFFQRHPICLTAQNLPVDTGPAISLHQHQVRVLREQQADLKLKLGTLVKNAKTNHKIQSDLLDLAGNLIDLAQQKSDLSDYLSNINRYFALFDVQLIDKTTRATAFNALKKLLGKKDYFCDNEPDAKLLATLLEDDASAVLSIAIVPVFHQKKCTHYLVLAADDASRFKPKMGGEFLKLLARLVSHLNDRPE